MDDMEEELLSTEIFGMAVPTGKTVTVGTALPKEDAEHVVHHLTQVRCVYARSERKSLPPVVTAQYG